jgi:hypothetical protein
MLRRVRPALVAAFSASLVVAGATVAANGGGHKLVDQAMFGIPTGGLTLGGVAGGGLPWVIDEGHADLRADGRLHIEVRGLVLGAGAAIGTNPIPTGVGIVSCGGAAAATTDPVPYSPQGDATVDARVSLPADCLAPTVFFAGVTGAGPRWFAVNGG